MRLDPRSFTPGSGADLQREPYTKKVVLTDGGVYDNLGLETVWKHYDTVLVSDGGGRLSAEEEPKSNWAEHSYRILNLIDNQVRARRKLQVVESYKSKERKGAYWGIWTPIEDYKLADALPCPRERALELAETPTRLARMNDRLQERLINWGYAVCDAAIRKYANPAAAKPKGFPYPAVGI
jgi:NTE family protein